MVCKNKQTNKRNRMYPSYKRIYYPHLGHSLSLYKCHHFCVGPTEAPHQERTNCRSAFFCKQETNSVKGGVGKKNLLDHRRILRNTDLRKTTYESWKPSNWIPLKLFACPHKLLSLYVLPEVHVPQFEDHGYSPFTDFHDVNYKMSKC